MVFLKDKRVQIYKNILSKVIENIGKNVKYMNFIDIKYF